MYISDYQASGWNLRSIYEDTQPDLLESEAFFIAFGRIHNLDGHKVMCVLAPQKQQPVKSLYDRPGLLETQSVLIVDSADVQGFRCGDSIRIDGQLYVISGVSNPSGGIVRVMLTNNNS